MMFFLKINNKQVFLLDKSGIDHVRALLNEKEDLSFDNYDSKDLSRKTFVFVRFSHINHLEIIESEIKVQ